MKQLISVRKTRVGHERLTLSAQGVILDVDAQIVFRDGDALPRLPQKEFLILKLLLEDAGRAISREELMERVWGAVLSRSAAKTLDVHVRRLRGHLEQDPHHPVLIRTLRGFGYVFDVTPVPTAKLPLP